MYVWVMLWFPRVSQSPIFQQLTLSHVVLLLFSIYRKKEKFMCLFVSATVLVCLSICKKHTYVYANTENVQVLHSLKAHKQIKKLFCFAFFVAHLPAAGWASSGSPCHHRCHIQWAWTALSRCERAMNAGCSCFYPTAAPPPGFPSTSSPW